LTAQLTLEFGDKFSSNNCAKNGVEQYKQSNECTRMCSNDAVASDEIIKIHLL